MTVTIKLYLDNPEDALRWQRFAHTDALCSILWKLLYGGPEVQLTCEEDMTRVCELLEAEGVIIEELWS